jgi:hypothetical protein
MDVTFAPVAPVAAPKEGTVKKILDFIKTNKWVWLAIAAVAYWVYKKFAAKRGGGFGAASNNQPAAATPVVAVNVPPAPATDPNFTRLSSA